MKFENIVTLDSIESTNTFLKLNSQNYETGTVLFANEQTKGRGRYNRKWEGSKGKSIFSSFLIKDISRPTTAIKLTFLFSVAIKKVLKKYIPEDRIFLKWPNDILIDKKKKICGILSEYNRNNVIIGVGINIFDFEVSDEIKGIFETIENSSSHLGDNKKEFLEYGKIKIELVKSVNDSFNILKTKYDNDFNKITELWYKEAGIHDKEVIISDDTEMKIETDKIIVKGKIAGIDEIGAILIENEKNGIIEKYTTGDLFFL